MKNNKTGNDLVLEALERDYGVVISLDEEFWIDLIYEGMEYYRDWEETLDWIVEKYDLQPLFPVG